MSSYLSFRKNEVDLCSFSRKTKIYQAFPNAPYDEWKVVSADNLRTGIANLKEERENAVKQKQIYERMATNGHLSYDDLYQISSNIQECEEEIEEINAAIVKIALLIEAIHAKML